MVDNGMPGTWPVWTPGAPLAGFIKRSIYTLLHTKYESSEPCGFGEDLFMFFVFFSNCKSMGAIDPAGWGHF